MANLLPCKGHGSGYCCLYKQRYAAPRGSTLPQTSDILHGIQSHLTIHQNTHQNHSRLGPHLLQEAHYLATPFLKN
jgi:hypothetical protein